MAVRTRSTRVAFVDEVNTGGVATQNELDTAISNHISAYHSNQNSTIFEDGIEYYYDSTNDRYLSKQFFIYEFNDNDTTTKNIYLNSVWNRCNYSPYRLPFNKKSLIQKVQVDLDASVSGNLFDIESDNGTSSITTLATISHSGKYSTQDTNIIVQENGSLLVYNNKTSTNSPRVTLWLRLIY